MESLFDPAACDRILFRIETLRRDSPRGWGKMDSAQALAHCAHAMEASTGDRVLRRNLVVKLIGPLFRGWLLGPKPFSKNSPTHPELVLSSQHDFEREKARLVAAIHKFRDSGPAAAARHVHAFIGKLTGEEWGRLLHKHLDHHLRQFGA
ncbi:MAG: DUF1569 domain-containing protein [Planctomycetota bacterium]|nr:DUF1569 domain-containing protein [Planctomycetota bacterium]